MQISVFIFINSQMGDQQWHHQKRKILQSTQFKKHLRTGNQVNS